MIKYILIILCSVILSDSSEAQDSFNYSLRFQQAGTYFLSSRVTIGGAGIGTGLDITYGKSLEAQIDANILWGNGNAASTRFALGYRLEGNWSPALFITYGLLFGQRTEILAEDGSRPPMPVWTVGLRLRPLRFERGGNSFSALEFGYGLGPDRGINLELDILSVSIGL